MNSTRFVIGDRTGPALAYELGSLGLNLPGVESPEGEEVIIWWNSGESESSISKS